MQRASRILAIALTLASVVAASTAPVHAAGAGYVAVTPCSLLDTRISAPPPASRPAPLAAGQPYAINVLDYGCIPTPGGAPSVSSVVLNVTALNESQAGFMTLWKDGTPWPGTSNINFSANQGPIANGMVVGVAANYYIDIVSSAQTDVLITITGYFTP